MVVLILSLVLNISGLVMSARYLLNGRTRRFWGMNAMIIAANVALFFMQGIMESSHAAAYAGMMQLVFFAAYILLTAIIAMVIGIRKRSEPMLAWAASVVLIIVLMVIVALG